MVKKKPVVNPPTRGQKYEFRGKEYFVRDFCNEVKISANIAYFRLKFGHTLEEIYRHYSPLCPKEEITYIKDRPLIKKFYSYQGKKYPAKILIDKFKIPKSHFYHEINIKGKTVEEVIENYSKLDASEALAMGFRRVGRRLKIRKTLDNGIIIFDSLTSLGEDHGND